MNLFSGTGKQRKSWRSNIFIVSPTAGNREQLIFERGSHAETWRELETDLGLRRNPRLSWKHSAQSPSSQPWNNWSNGQRGQVGILLQGP